MSLMQGDLEEVAPVAGLGQLSPWSVSELGKDALCRDASGQLHKALKGNWAHALCQ